MPCGYGRQLSTGRIAISRICSRASNMRLAPLASSIWSPSFRSGLRCCFQAIFASCSCFAWCDSSRSRYSPAMRSLLDVLYNERRALVGCLIIALGTALVAASLMHLAEANVQPAKLGTIPEAFWWAIVTIGTIGYGDVVPVTALGKFIATCTIFAGLVLMALPVGIIATAFAEQIQRRDFIVTWGMISRVPLFAELDATEISDVMELLRAQVVEAGEVVMRAGDAARSMYFIAAGEVEIEIKGKKERIRLGVGQFFGEVALLRRTRRTATVTAVTRTNLLGLDAHDLHALMQRDRRIAERIKAGVEDLLGRRGGAVKRHVPATEGETS